MVQHTRLVVPPHAVADQRSGGHLLVLPHCATEIVQRLAKGRLVPTDEIPPQQDVVDLTDVDVHEAHQQVAHQDGRRVEHHEEKNALGVMGPVGGEVGGGVGVPAFVVAPSVGLVRDNQGDQVVVADGREQSARGVEWGGAVW